MPILLVRHGPTDWNKEGVADRLRGWVDLPLTPVGEVITRGTAHALADQPVQHVYGGDYQRTAKMAQMLSQTTGAPFTLHRDLRPWDYGELAGSTVTSSRDRLEQAVRHPLHPLPGGESFNQFLLRYLPFVLPLLRDPHLSAVVTHGRNIKALEAHIAAKGRGISLSTWHDQAMVHPGDAVLVRPEGWQVIYEAPRQVAQAGHGS